MLAKRNSTLAEHEIVLKILKNALAQSGILMMSTWLLAGLLIERRAGSRRG